MLLHGWMLHAANPTKHIYWLLQFSVTFFAVCCPSCFCRHSSHQTTRCGPTASKWPFWTSPRWCWPDLTSGQRLSCQLVSWATCHPSMGYSLHLLASLLLSEITYRKLSRNALIYPLVNKITYFMLIAIYRKTSGTIKFANTNPGSTYFLVFLHCLLLFFLLTFVRLRHNIV